MTTSFDPTPYVRPPRLDIGSGVALAVALLSALAKAHFDGGTPAPVKKAAKRVRAACVALQDGWAARDQGAAASPNLTPKQADVAIDNAWGALLERLRAYADLPADRYPNAKRAADLLELLFPEGGAFLTLKYRTEWSASEKLLARIDGEGHAAALDALASADFLAEVRRCHADYGVALHITAAAPALAETTSLLPALQALTTAIGDYMVKLVAQVEPDDAATLTPVRAALMPIDAFRATQARGSGKPVAVPPPPAATPTTPVPDAPA